MGLNLGFDASVQSTGQSGTTQKVLSEEGIQKIIYDVMSSDQGLAALASGENASGGFGSSTKGLLAQDLIVKLAGEIANITAPTVNNSSSTTKKGGIAAKMSVICTELHRQGYLSEEVYSKGQEKFQALDPKISRGYRIWGSKIAVKMRTSSRLTKFFFPIAYAYYMHHLYGKKSLISCILTYIGHPLCYVIGIFVPEDFKYAYS